jgi:hypothetical protein
MVGFSEYMKCSETAPYEFYSHNSHTSTVYTNGKYSEKKNTCHTLAILNFHKKKGRI